MDVLNKNELAELKEILRQYKNLLDRDWIDDADKDYQFKKVNELVNKIDRESARACLY